MIDDLIIDTGTWLQWIIESTLTHRSMDCHIDSLIAALTSMTIINGAINDPLLR